VEYTNQNQTMLEQNLANNFSLSQNTKHINICQCFECDHQEEGMMNETFVISEDNETDMLNKNTSAEIIEHCQTKLMKVVKPILVNILCV
jgi:hypothetical protein